MDDHHWQQHLFRYKPVITHPKFGTIKKTISIIVSNWRHVLGFYVTLYVTFIGLKLFGIDNSYSWHETLFEALFVIPVYFFFLYGFWVFVPFCLLIAVLDSLLFSFDRNLIKAKLLAEWFIISAAFVVWLATYGYWHFLPLVLSFFITQYWRKRTIERVIHTANRNVLTLG